MQFEVARSCTLLRGKIIGLVWLGSLQQYDKASYWMRFGSSRSTTRSSPRMLKSWTDSTTKTRILAPLKASEVL